MAPTDPDELERIDREIRINELKEQAAELSGGVPASWEADDRPPDLAECFWRHVVAYEQAPWTSTFHQLRTAGVELPAPDDLDDAALTAKLWEVIRRLADLRTFLNCTDHLSDRGLYEHMWYEMLHEATKEMPSDENSAHHFDLLSGGGEEDTRLYLAYYADDEWRRRWQEEFPDSEMPARQAMPYDRDRHLPRATYGPRGEGGAGHDPA